MVLLCDMLDGVGHESTILVQTGSNVIGCQLNAGNCKFHNFLSSFSIAKWFLFKFTGFLGCSIIQIISWVSPSLKNWRATVYWICFIQTKLSPKVSLLPHAILLRTISFKEHQWGICRRFTCPYTCWNHSKSSPQHVLLIQQPKSLRNNMCICYITDLVKVNEMLRIASAYKIRSSIAADPVWHKFGIVLLIAKNKK